MNTDNIIKLTNRISLLSIILLIYWVFIFCANTVFGFKVFKANITESFYLSVIGILALLVGSVVVNIMFNLTKISDSIGNKPELSSRIIKKKKSVILLSFLLSFPIIFALLYYGDIKTSERKENFLVDSAKYMLNNNKNIIDQFGQYKFDPEYIKKTSSSLKILSKEDESFPSVSMIIQDQIDQKKVFLLFGSYYYPKTEEPVKADYIFPCSKDEREYLKKVFEGNVLSYSFSASDGTYELYFPVKNDNRIIVLYFTDRQRYGKLGS
ncbi:MAG: hypothetical protein KKC46_07150 [Proteobacteria bacterium]|nr:hypothetical protein [Pseudomonadota bacterium]